MTRKTLAILFIFLIATQLAAAETCGLKRNICDTGFAGRAAAADDLLETRYNRDAALLNSAEDVPLRIPAALYAFSKNNPTRGNELLTKQLAFTADAEDAAYLGMTAALYEAQVSEANREPLRTKINGAIGSTEAEQFLLAVGKYLAGIQPEAGAVTTLLKARGDGGWAAEPNPDELAKVAVGCAALLAAAPDNETKMLAEMNLDIIMARFAALNAAGAFAGVREGDTPVSGAFNPELQQWYGWSGLLFGTTAEQFSEPALLLSGYCANDAVRGVYESRKLGITQEAKETFAQSAGKAYTATDAATLFSSTVETGIFTPQSTPLTPAGVRFSDDPLSYILFSSVTSPDGDAAEARIVSTDRVIFGTLGASACQEPHVLVGRDIQIAQGDNVIVLRHNQECFALRFFGGYATENAYNRYRPLSQYLPVLEGNDADRGVVFFPKNLSYGGVFSFEQLPSTLCDDLDQAASVAADKTRLSKTSNVITYNTSLNSNQKVTYTYTIGVNLQKDGETVGTDGYGLRAVAKSDNTFDFIGKDGSEWTVNGELNGVGKQLRLNFQTPLKSGDGYNCPGTEPGSEPPGTGGGLNLGDLPEQRLAFLAAAMLQEHDAYRMDCGLSEQVFPNHHPDDLTGAPYACAALIDGKRTVGIVYDENVPVVIPSILIAIKNYYPFVDDEDLTIPEDLCDNAASEPTLAYVECDGIIDLGSTNLYVFVSTNSSTLILSEDANPATSGAMDGLLDWLRDLFTDPSVPEPSGDLAAFDRGYFFQQGEIAVSGRSMDRDATIFYDGLAADVSSLVAEMQNTLWCGQGTRQRIIADHLSDTNWRALTAALRITPSTALSFPGECAETCTGDDCDPPMECIDGDGDTYNVSQDGCGIADCDDSDIAINPGVTDELCTDCKDDNCNGLVNEGCVVSGCGPGTPGGDFTCPKRLHDGCAYVCNESQDPVDPTPPCPTPWKTVLTQGEYTFQTRINDAGYFEVKATPSNVVLAGVSHNCDWGGQTSDTDTNKTITWRGDQSKTRIFNWVGPLGVKFARVKLLENQDGWDLLFRSNSPPPFATKCWAKQSGSGPSVTFASLRPTEDQVCQGMYCPDGSTNPACNQDPGGDGDDGDTCTTDTDCEPEFCIDGLCGGGCEDDTDCEVGYYCKNGGCYNTNGDRGGTCFAPGTVVLLADGTALPIEQLMAGDLVLGEEHTVNTVTRVFVHEGSYPMLAVNGIVVTPSHLMKTERGWIAAGSLMIGDQLFDPAGTPVPVVSIERADTAAVVYNLETVPSHTYYADGVLVHNAKNTDPNVGCTVDPEFC